MSLEVRRTKFFLVDRETLFNYFTRAELLEKWASPDERMSVEVPLFEAKIGGKYRFEHKGGEGKYICTGTVLEFVPNEKIVECDELITGPKGETLFRDLECHLELIPKLGGTEVRIVQTGFENEKGRDECDKGWNYSLDKLANLVNGDRSYSEEQFKSEQRTQL